MSVRAPKESREGGGGGEDQTAVRRFKVREGKRGCDRRATVCASGPVWRMEEGSGKRGPSEPQWLMEGMKTSTKARLSSSGSHRDDSID